MNIKTSNFISGHVGDALVHFNQALTELEFERPKVEVVRRLADGLNRLQHEWTSIRPRTATTTENEPRGEVRSFKNMVRSGIVGNAYQMFLSSAELHNLVILEPEVINHKTLTDKNYDPSVELEPSLLKKAIDVHRRLRHAFYRVQNNDELSGNKVVDLTAELLYIVRSNIAHGNKTPFGDDTEKGGRDENVCRLVFPLQRLLFDLLLDSPSHRLLVYGTLAPSEVNHRVISDIEGQWQACCVRGEIKNVGNLTQSVWNSSGGVVEAQLFESALLGEHWQRLDSFEGNRYKRRLVLVQTKDGVAVANAYVAP